MERIDYVECVEELFDKYNDEYREFDRIVNKFSNKPYIHAIIMLDELTSGEDFILDAIEGSTILFAVDEKKLLKIITEDQVRDLCRCGIQYDDYYCQLVFDII